MVEKAATPKAKAAASVLKYIYQVSSWYASHLKVFSKVVLPGNRVGSDLLTGAFDHDLAFVQDVGLGQRC